MDTKYLNKTNHPDMGLNNTICTDKKYYCRSKMVYLSQQDADNKGCLHRLSADMIAYHKCSWLDEVKE